MARSSTRSPSCPEKENPPAPPTCCKNGAVTGRRKHRIMLIDLSPLKKYRDYRLPFIGQLISFLGTMISYMAVPYQLYDLPNSTALVVAQGLVQLSPVVIIGLLGGTVADRMNRRRLLLISEALMSALMLLLIANALLAQPSLVAIFVLAALLQAVTGFHRPALEALTQKMVQPGDYAAVSALSSFRRAGGAIVGPLLGGGLVAAFGLAGAYTFGLATYVG